MTLHTKAPKGKLYHRGGLINARGDVSAKCFRRPRAIDLKRASWTLIDSAVTCPKCIALTKGEPR